MAKPYIKLDLDWREDPKVMLLEDRYGKTAVLDWVSLMCVLGEFYGSFSLDDDAAMLRVQRSLGKKRAGVMAFIGKCAECGLVDEDALGSLRRVGSERSMRDGESRMKRKGYAKEASDAAAEKRRSRTESAP